MEKKDGPWVKLHSQTRDCGLFSPLLTVMKRDIDEFNDLSNETRKNIALSIETEIKGNSRTIIITLHSKSLLPDGKRNLLFISDHMTLSGVTVEEVGSFERYIIRCSWCEESLEV